jgi:hypothetical protein
MAAPFGNSTAGGCTMTSLGVAGLPLPQNATITNFVGKFNKAQTGGHIYAMTADANNKAVDVILLCTIAANSSSCVQTSPVNLTGGSNVFGFEFDGDRSWTTLSAGYILSSR